MAVNDIDGDLADQLATDISAHSGEAAAFPCDVSDWTAVDEMVSGVVSHFGRIDGLVNNAALFRMATLQDSTPELWNQMIGANVLGVAACGQRVAEEMVGQGSGSIVNITSGAQCGMDSMSIYGATKAAVASLTYTWAIELQSAGVRVNAFLPRGHADGSARRWVHRQTLLHLRSGRATAGGERTSRRIFALRLVRRHHRPSRTGGGRHDQPDDSSGDLGSGNRQRGVGHRFGRPDIRR